MNTPHPTPAPWPWPPLSGPVPWTAAQERQYQAEQRNKALAEAAPSPF